MNKLNEPHRLTAKCTVDADECIKLKELFHSRNLLAVEGLKAKQAINGFGMAINRFDVELNLLEIIQLEKPEIKKDKDTNLENTKVYTIDIGVIRKYAKLCGKDFVSMHRNMIGAFNDIRDTVFDFTPKSRIDKDPEKILTTITPSEINAMHEEKFGKTETPEEAEAFDIMAQDNERLQNHEMNNLQLVIDVDGKLYTADDVRSLLSLQELHAGEWKAGDECEIEMDGKRQPYTFGCLFPHDKLMAIVFTGNGYMTIPSCRLLKPETEAERKERESKERKLEIEKMLSISINFNNTDLAKTIARIIDDAGYRK